MKKTMACIHLGGFSFLLFVIFGFVWGSVSPKTAEAELAGGIEYETRKAMLVTSAAGSFVDDPNRNVETDLDMRSFDEINGLDCPKVIDNGNGWSVEARAGGRPFMGFENIEKNGSPWPEMPCTPGSSGIPQMEINDHYLVKSANRFWITHKASNGNPIVLVMTADGFYNPSGIEASVLQGAALRTGFIGEPFTLNDYLQHVENVSFQEIDDDILLITVDLISEAGEGVLELELIWDSEKEQPRLYFRSAHVPRATLSTLTTTLGVAGFNFMRGPTLHGLKSEGGTPDGGIEAFHDGRTAFLRTSGQVKRILLTSPVLTSTIFSETVSSNIAPNAKLIIDQPQDVANYYSKFPMNSLYEDRTDLTMTVTRSSVTSTKLLRYQTAVDLTDVNPEANETVNLFFAADMGKATIYEFSYLVEVDAANFEEQLNERFMGVVFISDRGESTEKLYYLQLDGFEAVGEPIPLTDGVISDPQRPSASANGRYIIFDADTYNPFLPANSDNQRIHILDLLSGDVRRITADPFGGSEDWNGRLSPDGTQFAFLSDRTGMTYLNLQSVSSGLGSSLGDSEFLATGVDWCRQQNELVFTDSAGLWLLDGNTNDAESVIIGAGFGEPKFSPDCEQIAYVTPTGLSLVARDGSGNSQISADSNYPTWIDSNHLIVQRTVSGNTDLYLLTIDTAVTTPLTTHSAIDKEPLFVSGFHIVNVPFVMR